MKRWLTLVAGAGLLAAACEKDSRAPTQPTVSPSPAPPEAQQPSQGHGFPQFDARRQRPSATVQPDYYGSPTITYHNGPIIYSQKVVAIYWASATIYAGGPTPGTSGPGSGDGSLIGFFLNHIGGSPYYGINTTYYDGTSTHVQNSVTYTRYWASNTNVPAADSTVSDATVQAQIIAGFTSGVLTYDANTVYAVFTDAGVNLGGGFVPSQNGYCAKHGFFTWNGSVVKYAEMPHAIDIDESNTGFTCGPWIDLYGSPNDDAEADVEVSQLTHEVEETNTDPQGSAWYDAQGNEDADKCRYQYDPAYTTANGAKANMNLGGKDFLIQQNWEVGTIQGCATIFGVATLTVSPNPVSICLSRASTLTGTATDQIGNAWSAGTVGWSSSDPSIATVTSTGSRTGSTSGVAEGQATITGTLDGVNGTSAVTVVYCPPSASVTGPYTMNLYQSGRFTGAVSNGVPPYTYEFRRKDCPVDEFSCQPWGEWNATGSTNYWDTVVYGCNIQHIYVQARVTDSHGTVSAASGAWKTYINNPC